ncbi:hypothetical protein ACNKHO_00945 [Shigella flexneri]
MPWINALYHEKTHYQDLIIFENYPAFGRGMAPAMACKSDPSATSLSIMK